MDKKIQIRIEKAITITIKIIIIGLIMYGVLCQKFIHAPSLFPSDYKVFNGEFDWKTSSGKSGVATTPVHVDVEKGETLTATSVLPDDLEDDMYISFYTGKKTRVYIDGKLRYDFDTSKRLIPGQVVKVILVPVKVSSEDCGKRITIEKVDDYYSNSDITNIYYGNALSLVKMVFLDEGPLYILAFVLLIFAIIVIMVGWFYKLIYKQRLSVTMLAYGVLMIALWCFYDSVLYQFVFDNYYIDGPMSYLIIMVTPYPFINYLDFEQKKRYHNIYFWLKIVVVVSFFAFSSLHFLGIASLAETLVPMNCVICAIVVATLGILFYDIKKGHAKQYQLMVVGFIGLIFFSFIEIILLNTVKNRTDGMCIMFGLYFLLTMAVVQAVKSYIKIQRETARAIQANKTKSTFLANMSHEIRTPINAIMGMDEMILRKSENEEIQSYAVNIRSAGNNLLHIINDILDFSKIESGNMEIVEDKYEMVSLLNDTINMVIDKINKKNLEFQTVFAPNIPVELYGDLGRIYQVITNILNNAVKYTKEGSVTLRVDCENISEEYCNLIIEVEDTGIGIKEKDLKKLFKDFQRLDLKKNRGIEGTGLGLAITKNLVDLMNGEIMVESTYEVGSKFTVIIPQKIIDGSPIGDFDIYYQKYVEKQSEYREKFIAPKAKLLFVDDNEMNLTVAVSLLEKTKIKIETALSANEMFELIKKNKYDMIFLDHMMPEIDGIKALTMSKNMPDNLNLDTPVVVLTANAIVGMKDEYLQKGFNDYLSKPIDPASFEEMILKYLPEDKVEITSLIDVRSALREYESDEELYMTELKKFCDSMGEVCENLDKCIENGNWEKYEEIVRNIKESSMKIGAKKLSNLSKQLESACKKEKFDFVTNKNSELELLYSNVVEEAATSVFLQ